MPTSPTLSEQLAALGIHLPVWPEEPEDGGPTEGWIKRGQAYLEGMRLWRAQLRSAAAVEGAGGERLISTVQDVGRQSAWDQSVIRYLLSDLQGSSHYQRVQAAAKLVAADKRTAAQRLGAAQELARDGFLVCGVETIKQLVKLQHVSERECFELCALLVANLEATTGTGGSEPSRAGMHSWLQSVTLQRQAASVLATAASAACGEQNKAELVSQLDTLSMLAAENRPEAEADERAAIDNVKTREWRQKGRVQGKPLLRTIHHLACTGGTVISKCLAAMPDVALISEINPFNRHGSKFEPTNPLLQLERGYRQLSSKEIIEEFARQISHANEICRLDDVDLVIREHSHSDFHMGTEPLTACTIANYLDRDYELLSVVTVRHPLDSYLGLLNQGWEKQFAPSCLDEYSRRYLEFLDQYNSLPMLRYEDFCAKPEAFMKNLCEILEVSYSAGFIGQFGKINITGDSGRKGTERIKARPRREVPEDVEIDIRESQRYSDLITRLDY
jgi:hypothetical protein